jgi:hypothetical protein
MSLRRAVVLACFLAAAVPASAAAAAVDTTPPTCVVGNVTPSSWTLTLQDTGGGLDTVTFYGLGSANFDVVSGANATDPVVAAITVTDPSRATYSKLSGTDFAGNSASCEHGIATAASLCAVVRDLVQNSTAYGNGTASQRARASSLLQAFCAVLTVPNAGLRSLAAQPSLLTLRLGRFLDSEGVAAIRFLRRRF